MSQRTCCWTAGLLGFVGGHLCILHGMERLVCYFLGSGGLGGFFPVGGNVVSILLEFGEFTLTEHEAIPQTTREEAVLKVEVPCHCHWIGLSCVGINQWPSVIAWCVYLREKAVILCTVRNDQAATLKLPSVGRILVHELEEGVAHADLSAPPSRTALGVEMGFIFSVALTYCEIHKTMRQLCREGHQVPIVAMSKE